MQFDRNLTNDWCKTIDSALPTLLGKVANSKGRCLILDACVLQIYQNLNWIKKARATGDLDLSIGLVSDSEEYNDIRQSLIDDGYSQKDESIHFRLYSPVKIALEVAYVDLLAHSEGKITDSETRTAIGVGSSWQFEGIIFALEEAYSISKNVYFPNPIGFIALKNASYIEDPTRVRDLVDIVDLVFALVSEAHHFTLRDIWKSMMAINPSELEKVKTCLSGIADESLEWDFSPASQEFEAREYDMDKLEEEAPRVFSNFLDAMK